MSARTGIRWAPLAIATAGMTGVALAAVLGLFEPGWGVAAAFLLLCVALAAGVIRDPDGPEIHVFLAVAMALSAGFVITNAAIASMTIERAIVDADEDRLAAVRDEGARVMRESWPKWIAIGAGVPIGACALAWRARRRTRT